MSEESLSALVDGECSNTDLSQLLDNIDRSPALKDRWSRMCLMREARRGTRIEAAHLQFASRVMAALDQVQPEAAVVVPLKAKAAPPKVVASPRPWRPLVGLAAAASLIGAVVLVIWQQGAPVPAGAIPVAPPSVVAAIDSRAEAKGAITPAVSTGADTRGDLQWSSLDRASAQELGGYLIDYSSYRSTQGMGGLGYARYAAHATEGTADPAGR
jgi:negative regulator of sigma E activity